MRGNFSDITENFLKIVSRLAGILAFFFVIYLIYVVAVYKNENNIGISEVKRETFAGKETISAICLREEQLLKLSDAGYVHVYKKPYERVSAQSVLFSVFDDFSLYNEMSSSHKYVISFDGEGSYEVKSAIASMQNSNYSLGEMNDAANIITSYYNNKIDDLLISNLDDILSYSGYENNFFLVKPGIKGVISYNYDEFIDSTPTYSELPIASWFSSSFQLKHISFNQMMNEGEAVCRIVTSDSYDICFKLNEAEYYNFLNREKHILSFTTDFIDYEITAEYRLFQENDSYFGIITLSRGIMDFIDIRRFEMRLCGIESTYGLKIPSTALTQKKFYKIPNEYVANQDEKYYLMSLRNGVDPTDIDINDENLADRIEIKISFQKDGYSYIDANEVDSSITITTENSQYFISISDFTTEVDGVYIVNHGYCEFVRVETLSPSKDYYIVKELQGKCVLKEYDRVVIDSSKVYEGELLIK